MLEYELGETALLRSCTVFCKIDVFTYASRDFLDGAKILSTDERDADV